MLDFVQAMLSGLIGAVFALAASYGAYKLILPRAKEQISEQLDLYVGDLLADLTANPQNYVSLLKPVVFPVASEYVGSLLADVEQNPRKYADLLKPIAENLVGQAFGGGKAPRPLKLGGFSIPTEIVAPLLERFINGGVKKTAENVAEAAVAGLS